MSASKRSSYGLSFTGMIIVAMRNSDAVVDGDATLCKTVIAIKDIYFFLKTHLRCFQDLSADEWEKKERVIRHTLSQTNYFCRYRSGADGKAELYQTGSNSPDRIGLWTMSSPHGEATDETLKRIEKVFKQEHLNTFRECLVNPNIMQALLDGTFGWKDPKGQALPQSDAKKRLEGRLDGDGQACAPESYACSPPPYYQTPPPSRVVLDEAFIRNCIVPRIPRNTSHSFFFSTYTPQGVFPIVPQYQIPVEPYQQPLSPDYTNREDYPQVHCFMPHSAP
ncbi:hypothetical protein QR680_016547 [Steinernema hermaphroditum]|uniref:Uncharacterized protein n=1 Tax=Steinernema hermaphroditum TaxID=289476 RepID=A0AA39HCJ5_9BILA|nr:hypothetical protein QR680_016547 [Steinernema hermaphroditum]